MIVSLFEPHKITKGDRAGSVVPGLTPTRWETTWSEFVDVLRDTAEMKADPADKAKVTSFSCAEFSPGSNRAKSNVLGCDFIGFDFDDKSGDTPGAWKFDALFNFMEHAGVPFVVHTTASCREEAQCLRLLLPLDRRVDAAEYPQVWRAFSRWLGSVADEATKDASRLFFEPRQWAGRYNRLDAGNADRSPIGVDAVVAANPSPTCVSQPSGRVMVTFGGSLSAPKHDLETVENITDLDTSPIITARSLEEAMSSPTGGRMYRFLCRAACSARRQRIALSECELTQIGEALAWRIGRKHRDDIRGDARNALSFAASVGTDQAFATTSRPKYELPRYW